MTETTPYPNELEQKLLDGFIKLLEENNVKFTKQYSPHPREVNRSTKIFVNQDNTKIAFHIYNVSDLN